MFKFSSYLVVAFASCLLFTTVFISCNKKDNNSTSGKPALYSFGPTGAKIGDTLRFIGVNLDKVTSIKFTGDSAAATIDQKNFKMQSSTEIRVLVPAGAEKGYVTLKTPEGNIITKTQLNLSVLVTETSMTQQARPGTNVTINGDYLNWVDKVTFAKNKSVTNFVSKTKNQLVVTIPADAQNGPLDLHYGGTDSSDLITKDTLLVVLPMASSFSPNPVKHNTNDTITGTNLDLTTKVWLTGVTNPITHFVSQTATQLVIKVDSSTQSGKVKLEAASGVQTTSATDLNVLLPSINSDSTGLTPNPIDPNSYLTINGTNLDLVTSVTFENAPAVKTFVSQSPTQIVVMVPSGVLRGQVTLGVLNSSLKVKSPNILEINGAIPPPTIALPFYLDAVTSNWNGWVGNGWGGSKDYANPGPTREGSKSIRIDYVGGYGSPLQLGGASVNLTPYTTFKISIFGAPGSGGKTVTIAFNTANGKYNLQVVEGKWTDYVIPISTLTSSTTLTDIWVQEFSGTGGFTIYVDAMGLN
jgi:IPT/TIG domain.